MLRNSFELRRLTERLGDTGYRFGDLARVGGPLTVITVAAATRLIPLSFHSMPPEVLLASRLPSEHDATDAAAGRLAERTGAEPMLAYVAAEPDSAPGLEAMTGIDAGDVRAQLRAEIANPGTGTPDHATGAGL